MLHKIIPLRDDETEYRFMPTMKTYILDTSEVDFERPSVVICPGGGYQHVSYREAERVALSYNAAGFHSFVVTYAVAPHKHPEPIKNIAKAIEIVRENAVKWHLDPNKIAVCGFSAGGHLAASISSLWNDETIFTKEEIAEEKHKPNGTILAYPVITSGEFAHKGSFKNLIGPDETDELWGKLSLETRVHKGTPPAFLWHTYEDAAVPVENTLLYVNALRKENIPFELHVFPSGGHGLSLVSNETVWSIPLFKRDYPWHELSVEWLKELFNLIPA